MILQTLDDIKMLNFLKSCELCPRRCKVDRNVALGFCQAGEKIRVALVSLHEWEEPCLSGKSGAGTIFFSNCNLKCVFCQNFKISSENFGKDISVERLTEIFLEQQERGAANIELVTPSHYTPQICLALDAAKKFGLNLPVVWNSNGYELPETLELLKNRVDVFLPDFKYFDSKISNSFSGVKDYFEVASVAVKKMFDLVGEVKFNSQGLLIRGVLVRHLILPNFRSDSMKILDWLYKTFGDKIFISIMNQYTPIFHASDFREIDRKLTTFEYKSVIRHAEQLGIKNCFIQVGKTASEEFIPNFDFTGV